MRLLLIIAILMYVPTVQAQSLISNSGFEDRNTCTELRAVCAPEGWFRMPLDPVSISKGTAGFLIGNHHDNLVMEDLRKPGMGRTFLYTRLLCPLEKGKEYDLTASFRVESDNNFYRVNVLWLPFEPFHYQEKIAKADNRITFRPQQKIADTSYGWKQYRIRFTATGDEEYMLIGNLEREVFPGKPSPQRRSLIVYEIDNVTLLPVENTVPACKEYAANKTKLYSHNYRHTPGQFIDDDEDPPAVTPPAKADTPSSPPPVMPPPTPVVNDTLVIPDVLFKFDKSDLNPVFAFRLDSLVEKIRNKTFRRIEVLGHTDSLGNNRYNQSLSKARAETVKQYLMDHLHYPEDIIVTKAFAATLPVSTNATPAGRQKNRRVEIVLIK